MMTGSTDISFHKVVNSLGTILAASRAFLLRPLFPDLAFLNTKSGSTEGGRTPGAAEGTPW